MGNPKYGLSINFPDRTASYDWDFNRKRETALETYCQLVEKEDMAVLFKWLNGKFGQNEREHFSSVASEFGAPMK